MRGKLAVLLIGLVIIMLGAGCAGRVNGVADEIPGLYADAPDGARVELVRFGYTWSTGELSGPDRVEVIACGIAPYEYGDYGAEHTITIGEQGQMKLSGGKENTGKGYIRALSYTIWKPDGSVYDDGSREIYSSLSLRMFTDGEGYVVLVAPFEPGEYIYGVRMEYERGTVEYGFTVNVTF